MSVTVQNLNIRTVFRNSFPKVRKTKVKIKNWLKFKRFYTAKENATKKKKKENNQQLENWKKIYIYR